MLGPGPAAYGSPNVDVYKKRAPAMSFGMCVRTPEQSGPGPQTYNVSENAENARKKFSFGIKHSPKSTPYIVPEDNRCP